MNNLPCINCITLAICRNIYTKASFITGLENDPEIIQITGLSFLIRKCEILKKELNADL